MSENTCSNCMLMRRGDCFGENKICEYCKPVPTVSKEIQENWPVIMRSSKHSRHLEWKKEQERLSFEPGEISIKRKTNAKVSNKNSYADNALANSKAKTTKSNSVQKNAYPSQIENNLLVNILQYYGSASAIRKQYLNCIIIWMCITPSPNDKYVLRYRLEFNGHRRDGYGSTLGDKCNAFYGGFRDAINRIKDDGMYDIIVVLSKNIISVFYTDTSKLSQALIDIKLKAKKYTFLSSQMSDKDFFI